MPKALDDRGLAPTQISLNDPRWTIVGLYTLTTPTCQDVPGPQDATNSSPFSPTSVSPNSSILEVPRPTLSLMTRSRLEGRSMRNVAFWVRGHMLLSSSVDAHGQSVTLLNYDRQETIMYEIHDGAARHCTVSKLTDVWPKRLHSYVVTPGFLLAMLNYSHDISHDSQDSQDSHDSHHSGSIGLDVETGMPKVLYTADGERRYGPPEVLDNWRIEASAEVGDLLGFRCSSPTEDPRDFGLGDDGTFHPRLGDDWWGALPRHADHAPCSNSTCFHADLSGLLLQACACNGETVVEIQGKANLGQIQVDVDADFPTASTLPGFPLGLIAQLRIRTPEASNVPLNMRVVTSQGGFVYGRLDKSGARSSTDFELKGRICSGCRVALVQTKHSWFSGLWAAPSISKQSLVLLEGTFGSSGSAERRLREAKVVRPLSKPSITSTSAPEGACQVRQGRMRCEETVPKEPKAKRAKPENIYTFQHFEAPSPARRARRLGQNASLSLQRLLDLAEMATTDSAPMDCQSPCGCQLNAPHQPGCSSSCHDLCSLVSGISWVADASAATCLSQMQKVAPVQEALESYASAGPDFDVAGFRRDLSLATSQADLVSLELRVFLELRAYAVWKQWSQRPGFYPPFLDGVPLQAPGSEWTRAMSGLFADTLATKLLHSDFSMDKAGFSLSFADCAIEFLVTKPSVRFGVEALPLLHLTYAAEQMKARLSAGSEWEKWETAVSNGQLFLNLDVGAVPLHRVDNHNLRFEPASEVPLAHIYPIPWLEDLTSVKLEWLLLTEDVQLRFKTGEYKGLASTDSFVKAWSGELALQLKQHKQLEKSVKVVWQALDVSFAFSDDDPLIPLRVVPRSVSPDSPMHVVIDREDPSIFMVSVLEHARDQHPMLNQLNALVAESLTVNFNVADLSISDLELKGVHADLVQGEIPHLYAPRSRETKRGCCRGSGVRC